MFFIPCFVIQLCNVKQQMHTFQINVLIQFFLSYTCFEHHVFITRKAICRMQFFYGRFLCIYVSSLAGGRIYRAHPSTWEAAYRNVWNTYHTKLHEQMAFLMMNTWPSKHVEDNKNWVKTLIWKVRVCSLTLHNSLNFAVESSLFCYAIVHLIHYEKTGPGLFSHKANATLLDGPSFDQMN